jgi:peptidyl-prolyl cis-trans isomerase A (cyclophilin A)
MVQIQRLKSNRRFSCKALLAIVLITLALLIISPLFLFKSSADTSNTSSSSITTSTATSHVTNLASEETLKSKLRNDTSGSSTTTSSKPSTPCEYKSLSDLKDYEAHPQVSKDIDGNNRRHAYDPPQDGIVTLVCCSTSAGPMSVAVHNNWAPLGAGRFLDMVKSEYFSSKVALMRCIHNFLCQFGIAGDPKLNKNFRSIEDDPNWLKEGPDYRTNSYGTKRFARGYFAYAGSGKGSRSNQLIVALNDNKLLGGGSPWEVPFGEVVGSESYDTLTKISTVYGDKGPNQGLLHREGSSAHVAELFPELDYVLSCNIVDTADMSKN